MRGHGVIHSGTVGGGEAVEGQGGKVLGEIITGPGAGLQEDLEGIKKKLKY